MDAANAPDQFYTGLVAEAYAPLRGHAAPAEPYERFVRRHGEPALEIGCGHGEPLLDLVAAGLDVTGLDASADMLALCRAEAQRRALHVTLVEQRMEEMSIDRRFRSIYVAGGTFQLVIDPAAALETLRRIGAHLEEDGRALIPLFTPQPVPPTAFGRWAEHVTSTGEVLAVQTVSQSHRPDEHRVDTVLRYRRGPADTPTEVVDRQWSLRWYPDGAFEALVDAAGLTAARMVDLGADGRSYVLTRRAAR